MKSFKYVFGITCLAVVAMLPQPAFTRADTWKAGDLFVALGTSTSNPGRIAVYDDKGVSRNQSIMIPNQDAGYTSGCYYNPESQTLWATTFDNKTIHEFDGTTSIRRIAVPDAGINTLESIAFSRDGRSFFVGMPYSSPQLARFTYTPAVNGGAAAAVVSTPQFFSLPVPPGRPSARVDWIDVTEENGQTVVYYTEESAGASSTGAAIYRYVPDTGAQSVFATSEQGKLFALRLLPAGSGMLVAGPGYISRFNMQGQEVFRYNGATQLDGGGYFALNITPDGRHFWTATAESVENAQGDAVPTARSGRLLKFDIAASSAPVLSVSTGAEAISGLCVKLEYTAARNVCSDPVTGAAVACPRLEICNAGGDDDGDGLIDSVDPDCLPPGTAEVCNDGEQADENRNGLINDGCSRTTVERTSETVRFAPLAPIPGDSITYSATGLPTGFSMSSSGIASGTAADGATGSFNVVLTADRTLGPDTTSSFAWTVTDVNRAPTAQPVASQTTTEGQSFSLQISASDPDTATDGDGLTYSAAGLPSGLSISSGGLISGQPGFDTAGTHSVTVTITDDHASRSTPARPLQQLNLSTTVSFQLQIENYNGPPTIVSVPSPGPYLVAAGLPSLKVLGSDPDDDAIDIVTVSASPSPLVINADGTIALAASQSLTDGTFTYTVRARDAGGRLSAPTTFTLTFISDQAPVCTAAAPSVSEIWPPNHQMVEIAILGITDPDGDAIAVTVTGIEQDEPTQTRGDGNTLIDGAISADGRRAFVRAERTGTPAIPGDGRVYRIRFTATAQSLSCSGTVTVGVPHDQRGAAPVASPIWYNSLTGARIQ